MIAIIPARGGSKGLPGKNIKELAGKPLIAYTVEAARNAQSVSRVIISTDSQEIADIAIEYGAECPFMRPAELASDTSLAVDAYLYTINRIQKEENIEIPHFMVLLPTTPMRTRDNIDQAAKLFLDKNADSVISYCEQEHPISWHKKIDEEGRLIDIFETKIKNRQDESMTFYPNGAIYIFKRELIERKEYYSSNSYAYVMSRRNSVDIDSIDDFEYAEYLINKRVESDLD